MRGYPERTLATRAKWLLDTRVDPEVTMTEWVAEMEAILKDLANAPEPEPVAHAILLPNGATRIWFSDRDSGELWRARERVEQELTPLYTSPPAKNQSEHHLEMLYTAPQSPKLTDERIDQLCDAVERERVIFSQGGIYALARAIEREILGGGE